MSIRELLEDPKEAMAIQRMLDDFCDLTGLAAVISDEKGNMLTALSNITDFCAVMRQHGDLCAKSDQAGGQLAVKTGKACIYKCHAGIIDFAVPVFVGEDHVGNILTGQVRTEVPVALDLTTTDIVSIGGIELKEMYLRIPFMDQGKIEKSVKILDIVKQYIEDRIQLRRIEKGRAIQDAQMTLFNEYKVTVDALMDCIVNVKYQMGLNLIDDLLDEFILKHQAALNRELFKNIYLYEMKNLKLPVEINMDYGDVEDFYKGIFDKVFAYILKTKCFEIKDSLDYAIAFIQRYRNKKLTSKDLARYMNLSADHFSKLFKQRFEVTALEYIGQYKMDLAAELLIESDESIQSIGMSLGYDEANYFSRVFKKVRGMSPKKFREDNADLMKEYVKKFTE